MKRPDFQGIANHLKVSKSAIKSVKVWFNCLFVNVAGKGGRFVSKKFLVEAKRVVSKVIVATKKVVEPKVDQLAGSDEYLVIQHSAIKFARNGAKYRSLLLQNVRTRSQKWLSNFRLSNHDYTKGKYVYLDSEGKMIYG